MRIELIFTYVVKNSVSEAIKRLKRHFFTLFKPNLLKNTNLEGLKEL